MRHGIKFLSLLATLLEYVVTYKSTNEPYDGQFRRIEVKLSESRDGMKVRTRRGYSAVASAPR